MFYCKKKNERTKVVELGERRLVSMATGSEISDPLRYQATLMTNEQRRVINITTLVVARMGCFSNIPWADVYIAKEAYVNIQGWEVESTWLLSQTKTNRFRPL